MNQQIEKQIPLNNSAAQMSHAEKIYSFRDLKKDVQDKLLQMQNTDGDFLRTDEKKRVFFANLIGLLFFLLVFRSVLSTLDFSKLNLVKTIVFAVISIPFIYWIAYFGRAVFRIFALPIKDHMYLTRTQIIETKDGAVRFFELKDVVGIKLEKYISKTMSGGWDYILNFEFADGFIIGCVFPRWWKEHYPEAEQWREKATVWRDEATAAFRRGDTAYFAAHDVILKAATANLPVLKKNSRFLFFSPRLMFKITFAMILIGLIAYVIFELTGLAK
jgi:hypothetical protein